MSRGLHRDGSTSEQDQLFGLAGSYGHGDREWGSLPVRAEIKIVRNGNAAGVNLPRQLLIRLGWIPGQRVICELLEDGSVRLSQPTIKDYLQFGRGRVVYDEPAVVTK